MNTESPSHIDEEILALARQIKVLIALFEELHLRIELLEKRIPNEVG
jgi:hypothetical protein